MPKSGTLPDDERLWVTALYWGYHTLYINPVVTFAQVLSLFAEANEIYSHRRTTTPALSVVGLGWQSIVFAVVNISWVRC